MSVTRTIVMDFFAIFAFAVLARMAHNTESDPFTLTNVLDTLWPFLLGGLIGHGICAAAKKHPLPVAPGGLIIWLATAVTGLLIWALRNGEVPHWSFIIVATVMSAVLLLGVRLLAKMVLKDKYDALRAHSARK
ncbi:DUF3054 domain-containing protein [uncultured Corynebacterium sp.]|uniref:DUF3054 domain-containing protein n=1 Tax=uncultured Corynebacterium sp. TaxID=159447 RepID=UPI00345D36F0